MTQSAPATLLDAAPATAAPATTPAAASEAPTDKLAAARKLTAKRVAEQRAAQEQQRAAHATAGQLSKERAARAASDARAAALEKRLAEVAEDPVERWIKEGLTVEQIKAKIAKAGDPVSQELAAIRAERKAEKEAAAAAKAEAEAAAARMSASQRDAALEAQFVARIDAAPGKYPHLESLPPEILIGGAHRLLFDTAAEKSRRTGRTHAECRSDVYSDDQILAAMNARIEQRAAARKAKTAPVEEAAVTTASGAQPGVKPAVPAPRVPEKFAKVKSFKALSDLDFDKLSEEEQFAAMAEDIKRRGVKLPTKKKR